MRKAYPAFFSKHTDVNIWLFQEVFNSAGVSGLTVVDGYDPYLQLNQLLGSFLPKYKNYFIETIVDHYGLSAFWDHTIKIIEKGENLIATGNWGHKGSETDPNRDHHRKIQWLEAEIEGKKVLVINAHLTHRPEGKSDSEKRIRQSNMIVNFMNLFDCPKILMGDFNLLPDTESIKIIEAAGLRNLIKEFGITETRTELYKKKLRFADYAFVSPEIKVKDFKVLPDVVSDHSPLYLDFEI